MAKMTPGLKMKVENTLQGDGSELGVELKFNSMADFDPARVAEQVEPLKKLMETRNKLRDLLTKADRSEDLEELLERVLKNQEDLGKLASDLGQGGEKGGGA
jgi:type VI secretion system protein ImpB